MIGGFDLFPNSYKEILSPKEYASWYHMLWIAPILLLLKLIGDLRVIFKRFIHTRK
jgi:hypothetical protein